MSVHVRRGARAGHVDLALAVRRRERRGVGLGVAVLGGAVGRRERFPDVEVVPSRGDVLGLGPRRDERGQRRRRRRLGREVGSGHELELADPLRRLVEPRLEVRDLLPRQRERVAGLRRFGSGLLLRGARERQLLLHHADLALGLRGGHGGRRPCRSRPFPSGDRVDLREPGAGRREDAVALGGRGWRDRHGREAVNAGGRLVGLDRRELGVLGPRRLDPGIGRFALRVLRSGRRDGSSPRGRRRPAGTPP